MHIHNVAEVQSSWIKLPDWFAVFLFIARPNEIIKPLCADAFIVCTNWYATPFPTAVKVANCQIHLQSFIFRKLLLKQVFCQFGRYSTETGTWSYFIRDLIWTEAVSSGKLQNAPHSRPALELSDYIEDVLIKGKISLPCERSITSLYYW